MPPLVITWFLNPINYSYISTIYHRIQPLICVNLAILGAPPCIDNEICIHTVEEFLHPLGWLKPVETLQIMGKTAI